MNAKRITLVIFSALLILGMCISGALAAEGDVTRNSPSDATVAITEPADQAFTVTIANTDPTNQTYIISWYRNGSLVQTDAATNSTTSATYTFVGGADMAGSYNITAISNTSSQAVWTLNVADFTFAGIQDILEETISVFTFIVSLVIGIVPILVVLSVVGLITGIFAAIVFAIKDGL